MDTVLGLVGLIVFIVCVIALAAGVTYLTIRVSPTRDKPKSEAS